MMNYYTLACIIMENYAWACSGSEINLVGCPPYRASRSRALPAAKAELWCPKKRHFASANHDKSIPQHAEILILNEQAAGIYVLKTLRNRELRKSVFAANGLS
jgi:hypothetical protein